ncbi:MAG: histidinol-phosphate transaminase [Candidatus Firestonebacteria bacterium]|nr:histidinol-phosphate transaminase [Candidatus Firestonebacteria bacterium]
MAQRERVSPDAILVGNGSDELIRDLLLVYGGPGTRTVFPAPTFSMYRQLTMATGGTPVGVRLRPDWSLDDEMFATELHHSASRLAFIASPNNPTGNAFDYEDLQKLVAETDRLVVLDEAYGLFAERDLRGLREAYPQVVTLKTFSKSMSLAGVRLGYLVADPEVIRLLDRVRLPYNVDALAQAVACRALDHGEIWEAQAQRVKAERERLNVRLQAVAELTVFPSQANFLLVRHPRAAVLKAALAAQGVAVRSFGNTEGLENCLRLTVGTPEENDRLLGVFSAGK